MNLTLRQLRASPRGAQTMELHRRRAPDEPHSVGPYSMLVRQLEKELGMVAVPTAISGPAPA